MPIIHREKPGKFTRPPQRVKLRKAFAKPECFRCSESLCDECDRLSPTYSPVRDPHPVYMPIQTGYSNSDMTQNFVMGIIVGAFVTALAVLAFVTFAHAMGVI